MAITFVSSNARPADNSTFGGNVNNSLLINAVGAATGDLVVVIAQYRGATTIVNDETGGQVWNSLTQIIDAASLCQVRYFWCRWSDETANGNNPNFYANGISTVPFTCTGHIFRPTTSSKLWAIDTALTSTQFTAPSTPFTVTRTGITTTNASTVTIASWHTADVNTWDTLSGTGWTSLGDAQNRNATGSGQSSTRAYKIMTSAGTTGDVSKNQATNGGDAGVSAIIAFYEYDASSPISGSAAGTSTATSTITGVGSIAGVSTGQAVASSTITGTGNITGLASGTSTATSNITGIGYLSGVSSGSSTATIVKLPSGQNVLITGRSEMKTKMADNSYLTSTITGASRIKRML